ncbi:MAG: protein-L-isoaspartate(D-aspartate) O-methyltransferase [Bernardetiaceae bacterium]|jgi:protein-L-isoaspartate(D-aspartate) O-methyltransferase|nr:protein-L-isoaspartate(D-aspartate) O-methyltransferase [Bernardetiaceae bacterium]
MQLVDDFKHKGLRRALVQTVQAKGITDARVLEALGAVPRHFFLDSAFLQHAYQDKAFGIGEGQTISQPFTVAFQTELLQVQPGDRVLEVGTGSGYQAAVLAQLGAKVYTIEYHRKLFEQARKLLRAMRLTQITTVLGDGSLGLVGFAPYQGILVTAAAPAVPPSLLQQLAPGGRLVVPVGDKNGQQMLRLTKQPDGSLAEERFAQFAFVPLLGKAGWQA